MKIQNYRGIKPAEIIVILEGDGTPENPSYEAQYVVVFETVGGLSRMKTIGKVIPLTEEERNWFNN